MEQRSEEWFRARLGKVTASNVYAVLARTAKKLPTQAYHDYKLKIITERLTGNVEPGIKTQAMQWGIEQEENAINELQFMQDITVQKCGFIEHPTIKNAGASPDGLIGNDGLIEIKCPNSSTHVKFIMDGEIKQQYIAQMQFQMACTGRKWCIFASYDPRIMANNGELRLKTKKIERDQEYIKEIEEKIQEFLQEIDQELSEILKQTTGISKET